MKKNSIFALGIVLAIITLPIYFLGYFFGTIVSLFVSIIIFGIIISLAPPKILGETVLEGEGYHLKYKDTYGDITERQIEVIKIYKSNEKVYMKCMDLKKSEERIFREDRIMSMAKTSTGEVII